MFKQVELTKAKKNPSLYFSSPRQLLAQLNLSDADKLEILKRWEQEARELAVAQDEGMIAESEGRLDEIIAAIEILSPGYHQGASAPNKHANVS